MSHKTTLIVAVCLAILFFIFYNADTSINDLTVGVTEKSRTLRSTQASPTSLKVNSPSAMPQQKENFQQENNGSEIDTDAMIKLVTHEVDSEIDRIKTDPSYNSYLETQLEYEQEPYNKSWAEPRADKINQLLQNDTIAEGMQIKNVSCRSTQCQIQVTYTDDKNISDTSQQLAMSIIQGSLKGLFVPYIRTSFDARNHAAIMYISDVQP